MDCGGAVAEGELSVVVRAGDDLHGGVVDIDVVDGWPGGDYPAGRQRPIGDVLVPGDPLGVAEVLGEQVAVAQDHRVAQQVRDDVDDAAVGHDVPDAPATLVPVDHLVAVPSRRMRSKLSATSCWARAGCVSWWPNDGSSDKEIHSRSAACT